MLTWGTCELNICRTCNMSCRGCSHVAPIAKPDFLTPQKILADLSILATCCRVELIRLLGGEPLLHPDLSGILAAVRSSGITRSIRICTNGLALPKMADWFWEQVDEVCISEYPGRQLSPQATRLVLEKAATNGVDVHYLTIRHFREPYAVQGTADISLVRRIYRTCQITHRWRCYTVDHGRFYKCPNAVFLPRVIPVLEDTSGMRMTTSTLMLGQLQEYLRATEPLPACQFCLGSVGRLIPHMEVPREEWRDYQRKRSEDLLDTEFLRVLEECDRDADNLCVLERR